MISSRDPRPVLYLGAFASALAGFASAAVVLVAGYAIAKRIRCG